MRPWIDGRIPARGASKYLLTKARADVEVMFLERVGEGSARAQYPVESANEIVAPLAEGTYFVGAICPAILGSDGRVALIYPPLEWVEDEYPLLVGDGPAHASALAEAHGHRLDATEQLVSDTKDALDATDWVVDGLAVEVTRQQVDIQQAVQDSQAAVQRANAAVTGSVVEYALGTSRAVAPTSGWTTSTVTPNESQVVWFRTVITYGSGQPSTTSPALLTGPRGEDGVGIEIVGSVATYANLPSGLGAGDAGKAYLVEANGLLYIWDGVQFPTEENGVEFRGPQGDQGLRGVSVVSITPLYRRVGIDAPAPGLPNVAIPEFVGPFPVFMVGSQLEYEK